MNGQVFLDSELFLCWKYLFNIVLKFVNVIFTLFWILLMWVPTITSLEQFLSCPEQR